MHLAEMNYDYNVLKIFEELYDGYGRTFDLLCGGKKVSFEYNKDMTVRSRERFERVVKF